MRNVPNVLSFAGLTLAVGGVLAWAWGLGAEAGAVTSGAVLMLAAELLDRGDR